MALNSKILPIDKYLKIAKNSEVKANYMSQKVLLKPK